MSSISQTFDQIKSVEAINGNIVLRVYKDAGKSDNPKKKGKKKLHSQVLSIREAAERAAAINKMVGQRWFSTAEAKDALQIVDEVIAKIKEAKQQREKENENPLENKL